MFITGLCFACPGDMFLLVFGEVPGEVFEQVFTGGLLYF